MFDIGASELLVIVIVAIIVIGPKELPLALRTAGRWIGKVRRVSSHFRSGIDTMIREAEMEEMDKKWREQNEAIMAKYPAEPSRDEGGDTRATQTGGGAMEPLAGPDAGSHGATPPEEIAQGSAEGAVAPASNDEPSLPFGDRAGQK